MAELKNLLFVASERGKKAKIARSVREGANSDGKGEHRLTALTKSVQLDKVEAAKTDLKGKGSWILLIHAFEELRIDSTKILVSKGAKASVTDKYAYPVLNLMMKLSDKKMTRPIDANMTE